MADVLAEQARVKVDQTYQAGLTDFPQWQFGKTLEELGAYKWDALPRAPEFKRNDVRYLILNIKSANSSIASYGCVSPTSYFVFFFESHKLFRISMRFFDEGSCPGHSLWLNHFANPLGAKIITLNSEIKYFDVAGKVVELLGASNAASTLIDLVSAAGYSLMTREEWLTFVKG
jgi:hypothetical protein